MPRRLGFPQKQTIGSVAQRNGAQPLSAVFNSPRSSRMRIIFSSAFSPPEFVNLLCTLRTPNFDPRENAARLSPRNRRKKVRRLRNARGLTQEQLASRLTSISRMSAVMSGESATQASNGEDRSGAVRMAQQAEK